MKIYALHGFLGDSIDWQIPFKASSMHVEAIDLFSFPINSLLNWATHFNQHVSQEHGKPFRCVLGYSLGGRLALHCVWQNPSLWDAAIIVSAHYGLDSEIKKQARRLEDERWARKFEEEEWPLLMKEWNAQQVFQNSSSALKKKEGHFLREQLAAALRALTLGNQECLLEPLSEFSLPILWMTGEKDIKFSELAKKVHLKDPLSKICMIPSAGHRVPWDQPEKFSVETERFLLAAHAVHSKKELRYVE